MIKSNGMMFILSSPSGAGKTTLTKKLEKNNKNFHNLNLSSYIALMPPSILISAPVINFDSSLAKNKTV